MFENKLIRHELKPEQSSILSPRDQSSFAKGNISSITAGQSQQFSTSKFRFFKLGGSSNKKVLTSGVRNLSESLLTSNMSQLSLKHKNENLANLLDQVNNSTPWHPKSNFFPDSSPIDYHSNDSNSTITYADKIDSHISKKINPYVSQM